MLAEKTGVCQLQCVAFMKNRCNEQKSLKKIVVYLRENAKWITIFAYGIF